MALMQIIEDLSKLVCKDLRVNLLAESHNSNVVFHSHSTFSEALVELGDKRKYFEKSLKEFKIERRSMVFNAS